MENKDNIQYIPIQYCPTNSNDEIDLKALFKTILSYKKFITIFTFITTSLAFIYVYFLTTPVYKIESNIAVGYNFKGKYRQYFLEPDYIVTYIKSNYTPEKNDTKIKKLIVSKNNDILNLQIEATSNNFAINYLNEILSDIKKKENKKLQKYINTKNKQIKILTEQSNNLNKELDKLNKEIQNIQDSELYKVILNIIHNNREKIIDTKLKISTLKQSSFETTTRIGKIIKNENPIKPKKKLIIIVSFITSILLAIFLVFFIEFYKNIQEN